MSKNNFFKCAALVSLTILGSNILQAINIPANAKRPSVEEIRTLCFKKDPPGARSIYVDHKSQAKEAPYDLPANDGRIIFRKGEKVTITIQLRQERGNRKAFLAMGCVPAATRVYLKNMDGEEVGSDWTSKASGWTAFTSYYYPSAGERVKACADVENNEICTRGFRFR